MSVKTCSILVLALSTFGTVAQTIAPSHIQWTKTFTGDGQDTLVALEQMPDGGYILGCHSSSGISGDKTVHYGAFDFWVLRLDASGNKVWEATLGGTGYEQLRGASPTPNGGVILVGNSASPPSGNKTAPLLGQKNIWVVLLDGEGNKLWDKSFAEAYAEAAAVECTSDGGFLVGGRIFSTTNLLDIFLVRLDASGNRLWERTFGTASPEGLSDLRKTSDDGFILAGAVNRDLWIIRIDTDGNKLWDRTFGGNEYGGPSRVRALNDGGFILGLPKGSPAVGNYDYSVLRLDAAGNKVWEHDFGGTLVDYFCDVQVTLDEGFVVAGHSTSEADGNKTAPRRGDSYDLWLVRLDKDGNRIWDETYDGIHRLGIPRIQPARDGGLMMAASFATYTNIPIQDVIIHKLSADALTAPQLRFPSMTAPAGVFTFQLCGISNRTYVTEFSTDLQSWSPLSTNQLVSQSQEIVDIAPAALNRFYRARMLE